MRIVLILLLAFAAAATQGQEIDSLEQLLRLRKELAEVELRLETYRRNFASFDSAGAREHFEQIAERFGPKKLQVEVLPAAEQVTTAGGGSTRFELRRLLLNGTGTFPEISRLLRFGIVGWVESLQLRAEADDMIAFQARVAYASEVPRMPLPPSGSPIRDIRNELSEQTAAADSAQRLTEAMVRSRALLSAFAEFMHEAESRPLSLTSATARTMLGTPPQLTLEGYGLGPTARQSLFESLAAAGLTTTSTPVEEQGRCFGFRLATRLEEENIETLRARGETSPSGGIFDPVARSWCATPPAPPLAPIVVGKSEAGRAPLIRLRNVDLASVFAVLHDVAGQNFVVGPDVSGRVNFDAYDNATLDEIYVALLKSGAPVSAEPVRIVGRTQPIPADRAFDGEPVTLQMHSAEIADIFCVAADVLGREIWMPSTLQRRISVYAENQPIDLLLHRLAATAGLEVHQGPDKIELGPRPAGVNACNSTARERLPRFLRQTGDLSSLPAASLKLAGLVRGGDSWTAHAILPNGRLVRVETGTKLADSVVTAVGEHGVTLSGGQVFSLQ